MPIISWVLMGLGMAVAYSTPSFPSVFITIFSYFLPFLVYIYVLDRMYHYWREEKRLIGFLADNSSISFYKWSISIFSFIVVFISHKFSWFGVIAYASIILALFSQNYNNFKLVRPFILFSFLFYVFGQADISLLFMIPIFKSGKRIETLLLIISIFVVETVRTYFYEIPEATLVLLKQSSVLIILLYWRYIIELNK